MSSSCGTVSLDRYWSYIGTPLFFTTIAVGVFTLFQVQDIQLLDKATIGKTVEQLRDVKKVGTGESGTPANVAKPAAPGKLARAAKTISALGQAFRKRKNLTAAAAAASAAPAASAPPAT